MYGFTGYNTIQNGIDCVRSDTGQANRNLLVNDVSVVAFFIRFKEAFCSIQVYNKSMRRTKQDYKF